MKNDLMTRIVEIPIEDIIKLAKKIKRKNKRIFEMLRND